MVVLTGEGGPLRLHIYGRRFVCCATGLGGSELDRRPGRGPGLLYYTIDHISGTPATCCQNFFIHWFIAK